MSTTTGPRFEYLNQSIGRVSLIRSQNGLVKVYFQHQQIPDIRSDPERKQCSSDIRNENDKNQKFRN